MTCFTLFVNFIHSKHNFHAAVVEWHEFDVTLDLTLNLLPTLWLFIHVELKCGAQISLVVETFLNPMCIPPLIPPVKEKKKIFEKKQMSNIRFG